MGLPQENYWYAISHGLMVHITYVNPDTQTSVGRVYRFGVERYKGVWSFKTVVGMRIWTPLTDKELTQYFLEN